MDPSKEAAESDEGLMTAIAAGDQHAFRILVERHQTLVIGTVARMIGTSDAEDVAQQVFLNVWKERLAVVLRRHDGMQYEEIAVVLGTSVSSVKSLLFRARSTLREKLAPYLEG